MGNIQTQEVIRLNEEIEDLRNKQNQLIKENELLKRNLKKCAETTKTMFDFINSKIIEDDDEENFMFLSKPHSK